MTFYQANIDSPLFPELRTLVLKTAGLVDVLSGALKPLARRLLFAFVHGSIASGTKQSDSDIDLVVVGSVLPMDLSLPLRRAGESLGRDINPTVYSSAEYNQKRLAGNHFLAHVLDGPKLVVIGNEHDLVEAPG